VVYFYLESRVLAPIHQESKVAIIFFITSRLYIINCLILIHFFNERCAAVAGVITYCLDSLMFYFTIRKHRGINIFYRNNVMKICFPVL